MSNTPERIPKTTAQIAFRVVAKVVAIALAVVVTLVFVLGLTVHYGNNMYPAVRDGDLVLSFRLQEPSINAAVLYSHDGRACVGRVIALEGHTVDISENGELTVNGIAPAEEVFYPTYKAEGSDVDFPLTVEPNKVFVLNDFRSDVGDSRTFGTIDKGDLMGPLLLVVRRRGF